MLAVLTGVLLRLVQVWGQPLLDDEWHGLHFIVGKNLAWLTMHFSIPGATCIPLNVYGKVLLNTIGLHEWLLRLPSIVAGLAMLLVFRRPLTRLTDRTTATWFQWLLACSPLLVLYSRVFRPYSPTALLTFAALVAGGLWLSTGQKRMRWIYFATSLAAVEFHLFAAVAVCLPLGVGGLFALRKRDQASGPSSVCQVHLTEVAQTATFLLVGALILMGWPTLDSMRTSLGQVAGQGHLTLRTLLLSFKLVAGTHNLALAMAIGGLAIWGAFRLFRENPPFALILVLCIPAHLLAGVVLHPRSIDAPVVLTRYSIVCVPVFLLLVARGLAACASFGRNSARLAGGLGAVILLAGFWTGPLPELFRFPNSFTAQTVYFQFHTQEDRSESLDSELRPVAVAKRTVKVGDIPPYYLELAREGTGPIIEFPMMAGDHRNPFYFYQRVHHRPVLIGYAPLFPEAPSAVPGMIYGNTYIDQVLSPIPSGKRKGLSSLVDLTDPTAISRSGATHLLLHRHLAFPSTYPPGLLRALFAMYRQLLGPPVYLDSEMAVFALKRS
ncbi:hypothetical protein GETHLI_00410 [Geothrix limicola]|uniref:Glycosyltransferase RgtA/B/C/D-like domain-containing protein n=1 Tax=Geothrix limicola TaxID=2927978 RepID=A0ABQ5QAG2_9BACT|nr:hypothetical protein GETHLI_00410 [Geothrix limicola]